MPSRERASGSEAANAPRASPARNGPASPRREAKILRPRELALSHRDAARQLRKIFAISGFEDTLGLCLSYCTVVEPPGPLANLAQPLDRGRDPGQRMAG